jgi:Fur family transcriptional regulator, ferric uptake regulator
VAQAHTDHSTVQRRNTRQREVILGVIEAARGPLSIPEILQSARSHLPRVGLATVYRTLNLLRDDDRIALVTLPGEEPRFEPSRHGHHHHHFRCRVCERVFELETCPVSIPKGSLLPGGFLVEDHHLTMYGLCADCTVKTASSRSQA